ALPLQGNGVFSLKDHLDVAVGIVLHRHTDAAIRWGELARSLGGGAEGAGLLRLAGVERAGPPRRDSGRLGGGRFVLGRNLEVHIAPVGHQANVAVAAGLRGRRALLLAAAGAGTALAAAAARTGRRELTDLNLIAVIKTKVKLKDFFRLGGLGALLGRRR